jgi:pimeloyl-ACP methyl ester carboxylesterase
MKQVYLIPAPDMDERAIEAVSLEGVEFVRINLPKLTRHSNLKEVTNQLSRQIELPKPIILGFCYGGVLAVELGKQIEVEQIIVVSGVTNNQEIVFSRKVLALGFCFVPEMVLRAVGMTAAFLLNNVLRMDVKIPRIWAKVDQNRFILKHALNFDCRGAKGKIVRIHGSKDRVVPLARSAAEYIIKGGGHFMFIHRRRDVLQAIGQAILPTRKN